MSIELGISKGDNMEEQQPWQVLCEQAANEQDGERLMVLVSEISRLLGQQLEHA
jgi:hypothetical protein